MGSVVLERISNISGVWARSPIFGVRALKRFLVHLDYNLLRFDAIFSKVSNLLVKKNTGWGALPYAVYGYCFPKLICMGGSPPPPPPRPPPGGRAPPPVHYLKKAML